MLNEFPRIGEYQVAYDGHRLADYVIVRGVDTEVLPPITADGVEVDGRPGAWFTGCNIGTRDIVVRLGLLRATRDRLAAMEGWMAAAAVIGRYKPCRLDLGEGYWAEAVVVGSSKITRNGMWSTADITFRCFDPHIYGQVAIVPLQAGSNTVTVLGTAPTAPVFELRGTGGDHVDVQDGTTKRLVRVYDVGTSNVLTVDMGQHKCTQGLSYKAADPSVTDFWSLEPGEREVVLVNCTGSMTYTEAYL